MLRIVNIVVISTIAIWSRVSLGTSKKFKIPFTSHTIAPSNSANLDCLINRVKM